MAPETNRFNSFLRILENAISSGKKKKKKPKSHKSLLESYLPGFLILAVLLCKILESR